MKKKWYLMSVLSLLLLVMFSFISCEKFKVDNLKANRHFKQANGLYEDEQYQDAAEEYKKALDLNPNATQYYIYLGTASSMAYQPSMLPPEKNIRYQTVEETNQQLELDIETARTFVSDFEANEEYKQLLDTKVGLEGQIEQSQDELRLVSVEFKDINRSIDYNKYSDFKTRKESAERRLKDNEAYFQKVEEEKNQPKDDTANEDLTIAQIQAEWEQKRDSQRRQKQLVSDRDTIEESTYFVEYFEKDANFIEKLNELTGLGTELTEADARLTSIEDYKIYINKIEEIDYKTKEIEYNKNYKREVVQNEEIRKLAIEYLNKALEGEKDGGKNEDKVLTALSDLFSKMITLDDETEEYFKEAEKHRRMILEKDPDNMNNFYVMAEFYKSHRKIGKVIETYQARINLDPNDSDVYTRFGQFLGEARLWDQCIEMCKRRIYALLSPEEILPLTIKIDANNSGRVQADKAQQLIDNVRKQKVFSTAEKNRIINEQLQKMKDEGQLTLAEIDEQNKVLQTQVDELFKNAENGISQITDEKLLNTLKEAYYTLGVRHWNFSYYSDDLELPRDKRKTIIEDGIVYLTTSSSLDETYAEPVIYTSLLWREKTKVNSLEYTKYRDEADKLRDKYSRMKERQAKKRATELQPEGE